MKIMMMAIILMTIVFSLCQSMPIKQVLIQHCWSLDRDRILCGVDFTGCVEIDQKEMCERNQMAAHEPNGRDILEKRND